MPSGHRLALMGMLVMPMSAGAAQLVPAAAPTVLFDANEVVSGHESLALPLDLPGAGSLEVTATPLPFMPQVQLDPPLLQFERGGTLISTGYGDLIYRVEGPLNLYADVFASVAPGTVGLYNLTATFTPASAVPLPGGIMMLAPLLAGWSLRGAVARRPLTIVTTLMA